MTDIEHKEDQKYKMLVSWFWVQLGAIARLKKELSDKLQHIEIIQLVQPGMDNLEIYAKEYVGGMVIDHHQIIKLDYKLYIEIWEQAYFIVYGVSDYLDYPQVMAYYSGEMVLAYQRPKEREQGVERMGTGVSRA